MILQKNIGLIIGISAGCLVGVGLLSCMVLALLKHRKNNKAAGSTQLHAIPVTSANGIQEGPAGDVYADIVVLPPPSAPTF